MYFITTLKRILYFLITLVAFFCNFVMFFWIGALSALFVFLLTISKALDEYLKGQERVTGFTVRLLGQPVENS